MGKTRPKSIATLIHDLLLRLGQDPTRDGLAKTPERVEESLRFLTSGYEQDVEELVRGAIFEQDYDEMIVLRDIDFFSLCEHHLLPFYGKCHIAYIPRRRVIGLSKLPRIVNVFCRRLQIQERLTCEIANCLHEQLNPWGVAVVMEAMHLCIAMRGVQRQIEWWALRGVRAGRSAGPASRSKTPRSFIPGQWAPGRVSAFGSAERDG